MAPAPTNAGAPPRAPGSFRFTTKGTKGVPGALPLDPAGGLLSSPQQLRCSPQKDSPKGREVRRELVLPSAPEDAADFFPPQPIPLGQKLGESKGGLPLVPEVQEPGGSWRIFRSIYAATFLYARK